MGDEESGVIYGSVQKNFLKRTKRNYDIVQSNLNELAGRVKTYSAEKNTYFIRMNELIYDDLTFLHREFIKVVQELNETKNKLKEAQASANAKTYAQATQQARNENINKQPHPMCTVKVTPKADAAGVVSCASSDATKKLLSTIDLSNSDVGVKGLWKTGGKGITVSCRSKQEADKLVGIISQEIGDKVVASKPKLRNPAFSMLLPSEKFVDKSKHDELKREILARNNQLEESDANPIDIVFSKRTKNGNALIFLEVGSKNYHSIIDLGSRLFVGWELVKLRKRNSVSQCFNCYKFWHKANQCRYEVAGIPGKRCVRCGGAHDGNNCSAPVCCSNCTDHNKYIKGNGKHNTDHMATDAKCPMRLSANKKAEMLINYD